MSRIGKQPVVLPSGVEARVEKSTITVKGPKGELKQDFDPAFDVTVAEGRVSVQRPSDEKEHRAKHGLYRALIANMVAGVSAGFSRRLEIEGVGYSARSEGPRKLSLNIGFCHPVVIEPPEGVEVETPSATVIIVKGTDKQKVGQLAAEIRGVRPPEPYKGKGIRYAGEHVRRKAGKAVGGK
jgi:large subunit ribosomal protein L6